jgi:hypothetical protein
MDEILWTHSFDFHRHAIPNIYQQKVLAFAIVEEETRRVKLYIIPNR